MEAAKAKGDDEDEELEEDEEEEEEVWEKGASSDSVALRVSQGGHSHGRSPSDHVIATTTATATVAWWA